MDENASVSTRRALHGVAELVLAGPQQRAHGAIHLRALPGEIRTVVGPVRIEGVDPVGEPGRRPITGRSSAEPAVAVGATAGAPAEELPDADAVAAFVDEGRTRAQRGGRR